ncbi:MAG TPA: outer membrane beta-barrel protein [Bryobacteraceae bacterium]|nr:outer membrane beta-barrel protein [Bryobacteraceae bacterium]
MITQKTILKCLLASILIGLPAWAGDNSALASLRGTAHSPEGIPIPGVRIFAHHVEDNRDTTSTSGTDGSFTVEGLKPGQYQIYAGKAGFVSSSITLQLPPLETTNIDLPLQPAGTSAESALLKALESMQKRMDQLEAELHQLKSQTQASALPAHETNTQESPARLPLVASLTRPPVNSLPPSTSSVAKAEPFNLPTPEPQQPGGKAAVATPPTPVAPPQHIIPDALQAPEAAAGVDNQTPFAYGDFSWLNGSARTKDTVLDTKFFTPEARFDTHYMEDFNQPVDHTIVGSTESFRSGEVQLEQISVGGDFHWQNVRGRVLFMNGLFAVTTPRNDASAGVGQWDLRGAYRYVSEAYGGYHFNVNHGLNVDAGIFVSYIGLFSYYNFDNWAYQPSYVSSNTPWFFNGVRVQWFPTNKLKIEPWFINGWQSYAKYNGHPGVGGQLLWMPKEWFKLVANQYGLGQDNLGLPRTERIHTDDSIEVRYYNKPASLGLSKMAFSLTGDAGCQYGGGIQCLGAPSKNKSSFVGWMLYNRMWFHKDLLGLTLGGGYMNNYGRYLTLLPPINGADAVSGTPYFTENPGQKAHMWDSTVTLQYMPRQYITWFAEVGYRHSDVPYFAGRGGVTPPGGNTGSPQYYTCSAGGSAGTAVLAAAEAACGGGLSSVWFPDLRRSEAKLSFGLLVKF